MAQDGSEHGPARVSSQYDVAAGNTRWTLSPGARATTSHCQRRPDVWEGVRLIHRGDCAVTGVNGDVPSLAPLRPSPAGAAAEPGSDLREGQEGRRCEELGETGVHYPPGHHLLARGGLAAQGVGLGGGSS